MTSLLDKPALPIEVIENVIWHASDDPRTLRSLSLTCRQLRPRSFLLMVTRIDLKSRDHVFSFCEHLRANPHLQLLVREITIDLLDFAPYPLLSILPNLSRMTVVSRDGRINQSPHTLHQRSLTCCKLFGGSIETLYLSCDTGPWTLQKISELLMAFKNIRTLICAGIHFASEEDTAHIQAIKQRMSERLHLRSVTVSYPFACLFIITNSALVTFSSINS